MHFPFLFSSGLAAVMSPISNHAIPCLSASELRKEILSGGYHVLLGQNLSLSSVSQSSFKKSLLLVYFSLNTFKMAITVYTYNNAIFFLYKVANKAWSKLKTAT